jgi:hypothetical protein
MYGVRGVGDASTTLISGTANPGVTSVGGVLTGCVCGPPGYCYGADFCSKPQLDSKGRDFRTDATAGSPGPTNSTMIGIGVAALALLFVFFGGR